MSIFSAIAVMIQSFRRPPGVNEISKAEVENALIDHDRAVAKASEAIGNFGHVNRKLAVSIGRAREVSRRAVF